MSKNEAINSENSNISEKMYYKKYKNLIYFFLSIYKT